MTVRIRPAQLFDAGFAAPLIQSTIGGVGRALTGTATDEDAAHVLAEFFPLRGHRLSFTHTLIAETGSQPVGLLVSYPGEFAVALDGPFRDHLRTIGQPAITEPEGQPGELYLDTLAVSPGWRGRGVGGALLEAAVLRAQTLGLTRLGLLSEAHNPATRLYTRHGFEAAGERTVSGIRFIHLILELPAAGAASPSVEAGR